MKDQLQRLRSWYEVHCDGEWELEAGIRIATISNPGWSLHVRLTETELEAKPFEEIRIDYDSDRDWLICRKNGDVFEGFCGPTKLEELLERFLSWAEHATR